MPNAASRLQQLGIWTWSFFSHYGLGIRHCQSPIGTVNSDVPLLHLSLGRVQDFPRPLLSGDAELEVGRSAGELQREHACLGAHGLHVLERNLHAFIAAEKDMVRSMLSESLPVRPSTPSKFSIPQAAVQIQQSSPDSTGCSPTKILFHPRFMSLI